VYAQNYFANPSFEAINNCVEYKFDCATEAWFNIPATNYLVKENIAPKAFTGNMVLIVPAGNVMANFNKPRYVYTGLCCPLVAGKKYLLSFYINTAQINFKGLEFYFTQKEPSLLNINGITDTPSVIFTKENIVAQKKDNWFYLSQEYIANGTETFFIIGTKNFIQTNYSSKDAMNKSGDVLYFIDEVELKALDSVALCDAYKKNIDTLFDYNYRHTDNIPIFKVPEPVKPVIKIINDTVVIPGLLFDVNKSSIKPAAKFKLDSLCMQMQIRNFAQVNIIGHTDSTGNEINNQILSESRAATIKNYLAAKLPAAIDRMHSAGMASLLPKATNKTAAGRQQNRGVEIIITYLKPSN
jgi:outer membrane protein OmpA-like peptidoglycan-associated protein